MPVSKKSKSMKGAAGDRKLASSHGRKKQKSSAEPQRETHRSTSRRTGSSKQRKG